MKRLGPTLMLLVGVALLATWWVLQTGGEPPPLAPSGRAVESAAAPPSTAPPAVASAPAAERAADPPTGVATPPVAGARLNGTVRFADGRAAAGAAVRLHRGRPPLAIESIGRGALMRRATPGDGNRPRGQPTHDLSDRDQLPFQPQDETESEPPEPPEPPLAETRADDAGRFVLTGISGGTFHLDAVAPLAWCTTPLELTVVPDVLRDGLDLTLEDGAGLRGRVVGPAGAPVAGARVTAATRFDPFSMFAAGGMQTREPWRVVSDADGRFALAGVAPALELDLRASAPGYAPAPRMTVVTRLGATVEAECRLLAAATIDVSVTEPGGAPAAGLIAELAPADLKLDELSAGDESLRGVRRKLDASGCATFGDLAPGRYDVRVDRAPWLDAHQTVELAVPGARATASLVLVAGLELRGRVTAKDGTPLAGATVAASEPPSLLNVMKTARGGGRRQATCDDDGRFALHGLPSGSVDLTARAAGYVQSKVAATAGGPEVVVVLATRGAIEGIVISQQTGKPLREFVLHLERRGDGGGGMFDFEATLRTRAIDLRFAHEQGKFRVAGVAPGEMRVAITAAGHGRFESDWFKLEDGATRKGMICTLGPEAVIEGVVVAAESGEPVAGATVGLLGANVDPMSKMLASLFEDVAATTAADGHFAIGELGAGRHRLAVAKQGFVTAEPAAILVAAGERVGPLRIELAAGGEIWGEVQGSDGSKAAGASLMCQDMARMAMQSTRSDGSGRYRFSGLAPGSYALTRMPAEMSFGGDQMFEQLQGQIETYTVKLKAGESLRIDFGRAPKGSATLVGQVQSGGAPIPQAMVQLIGSENAAGGQGAGGVAIATSDVDGRFRFEHLAAGRAFVQVNLGDLAGGGMNAALVPVHLRDGETTEVTLDVPAARVRGVVVDAESRAPLAGIAVYVGAPDGASAGGFEQAIRRSLAVRTDVEGRFELQHVRPGRSRLVAGAGDLMGGATRDHAVGSVPITVPASGTLDAGTVALQRAATIAGTLSDATGQPLAQGSIFLRDAATGAYLEEWSSAGSDANGEFEYVGVPVGTWDVVARAPGHATAVARGITTRTGEVARVRLELAGGTEVFAVVGELPFEELLDLSLAVDGPDGPVPMTLFGLSELAEAMRAPWQPDVVRLGRFAAGRYRVRGRLRDRTIDQEFVLAGEPELRIPVTIR